MQFTEFLDCLLFDDAYPDFVDGLRNPPHDRFYENDLWHSVSHLLQPYPDALTALNAYAFLGRDSKFSFSVGNLKACYIQDEDFINNGRSFILFNLVATTWFHVGLVGKQIGFWKVV